MYPGLRTTIYDVPYILHPVSLRGPQPHLIPLLEIQRTRTPLGVHAAPGPSVFLAFLKARVSLADGGRQKKDQNTKKAFLK